MDPSSKLPKIKQVWQPAKSSLFKNISSVSQAKDSLPVLKKVNTNLRRSKSFSELQMGPTRKPIADRNGLVIHPLLPKPDSLKNSRSFIAQNKENKPVVRNNVAPKRPGGFLTSTTAPKQARNGNIANNEPTVTTKPISSKKIPLYDYKARFNDLLEKHKPMKTEYLELKRTHDSISEELLEMRAQWESYANTLEEYKKNAESDRSRIMQLSYENNELLHKYKTVENEREELKTRLNEVTLELETTKQTLYTTSERLTRSEEINREQEALIAKQAADVEELQESTQKLHWERRSLHNKIQDMKGNIRVIFRVRPALAPGRAVAALSFPDVCTIELERLEPGAQRRLAKHDFKFDRVFGPSSSQEDVWEEVSCLVQSALDGYNVCIFAYGQTGSGKTFTMEGTGNAPGVIPRSCTMLFQSIKQLSRSGWQYSIHVSFLEIYNEQLYDLLQPSKDPKDLDIRMADAKGSDVYVTNLAEQQVFSAEEMLRLAARAQMHRQTAATSSNERSSRSHSVARIRLVGNHAGRALSLSSRLCLVDLAGSESAKSSQRINETKNINKSLSELGKVILALQQKQDHIPFRNSKLTRLLEPQLGGAAKALLVAAAAPYDDCSHESLSTLRFATQVGHCSTAAARRHIAQANTSANV